MHDAIKLILAGAFVVPSLSACSGERNPDQNVVITENIPADAEIEALPADEGGTAAEAEAAANAAGSEANAQ